MPEKYWPPKFQGMYAFCIYSNILETRAPFPVVTLDLQGFCPTQKKLKNGKIVLSQFFLYR